MRYRTVYSLVIEKEGEDPQTVAAVYQQSKTILFKPISEIGSGHWFWSKKQAWFYWFQNKDDYVGWKPYVRQHRVNIGGIRGRGEEP